MVKGSLQKTPLTWDTADSVDILHDVLATRSQIGQERNPVRDSLELVEGELDADRVGNGYQMQNGVGRSAERHGENLWIAV